MDSLYNSLHAEIETAESSHADAGRLGNLWRRLGIAYQSQYADAAAEDAYAHAIPLLQAAGAEAGYADALHQLGCVYINTGRAAQGRKYLLDSLAIYEKTHDTENAAFLHQALGIGLLFDGKFRKAAEEFSASVADITASPNGQSEPLVSGYLLLGGAEYRAGDAAQALAQVARARAAAAKFNLAPNSLERIAMAVVEGAALTRLGRADEGDAAIQEAMRLAATRTDMPQTVSTGVQMAILREYSVALQTAHRKQEAKRVGAEVAMLQSKLPGKCGSCTISVAALSLR
jgi:tetratricopeptide (TPR) repeat protein